jgi:2-oxoisovalerate dehydrogenase E2 component (dihydrolipoyl transacylase)
MLMTRLRVGNEIIYRGAHNIGFALASSVGLLVPVWDTQFHIFLCCASSRRVQNVKNVEQLSLLEVAKEVLIACACIRLTRENRLRAQVHRLIEAGRANKLTPADLSNGSLTLSNIGTVGGELMCAIAMRERS